MDKVPAEMLIGGGGGGGSGEGVWTAVIFQNGWVNYAPPYATAGYRKDSNGIVHIRGLVKSGAIGTPIFTLPPGYRSPFEQGYACVSQPNAFCRVDVKLDGAVIPQSGNNGYVFLDVITFYTD